MCTTISTRRRIGEILAAAPLPGLRTRFAENQELLRGARFHLGRLASGGGLLLGEESSNLCAFEWSLVVAAGELKAAPLLTVKGIAVVLFSENFTRPLSLDSSIQLVDFLFSLLVGNVDNVA